MKKIDVINLVHKALQLSIEKSEHDNKIYDVTSKEFKDPPVRPSKEIAKVKKVEIISNLRPDYKKYTKPLKIFSLLFLLALILSIMNPIFTAVLIFFSLFMFAPFVIYIFYQRYFVYPKEVQKDIERIKMSLWYLNQVKTEENAAKEKQKEFDRVYADKMKIYKESYAQWESEKEVFERNQDQEYQILYSERAVIIDSINSVCDTVGIPSPYRNADALSYIYNILVSSNFTVIQAIEAYDRERQRLLDERRISEMRRQNNLQEEYNSEMRYQSDLQERANNIAQKHRRESAAFGVYNAYHNHKQTKMMKENLSHKSMKRDEHEDIIDYRVRKVVNDFNKNSNYH